MKKDLRLHKLYDLWDQSKKIQNLHKKYRGLCVACSGGPDSIALLHLLNEYKKRSNFLKEISLIHINYELRGKESDADEAFVMQVAKHLKIRSFVYRPLDLQKQQYTQMNTQEWARNLRYLYFERLIAEGWLVAIGHNKDDLAENILFRMIRGSGPRDLSGMNEFHGSYWRPLLNISKKIILDYLSEQKTNFRIDSSNLKLLYSRNILRQKVFPVLEKISPSATHHIVRSSQQNADLLGYLLRTFDLKSKIIRNKNEWKLPIHFLAEIEEGAAICILAEFVQNFSEGQVHLFYDKLNLMLESALQRSKIRQFQLAENIFCKFCDGAIVLFRKNLQYYKELRFKQHEAGLTYKNYFFALNKDEEVDIFLFVVEEEVVIDCEVVIFYGYFFIFVL